MIWIDFWLKIKSFLTCSHLPVLKLSSLSCFKGLMVIDLLEKPKLAWKKDHLGDKQTHRHS